MSIEVPSEDISTVLLCPDSDLVNVHPEILSETVAFLKNTVNLKCNEISKLQLDNSQHLECMAQIKSELNDMKNQILTLTNLCNTQQQEITQLQNRNFNLQAELALTNPPSPPLARKKSRAFKGTPLDAPSKSKNTNIGHEVIDTPSYANVSTSNKFSVLGLDEADDIVHNNIPNTDFLDRLLTCPIEENITDIPPLQPAFQYSRENFTSPTSTNAASTSTPTIKIDMPSTSTSANLNTGFTAVQQPTRRLPPISILEVKDWPALRAALIPNLKHTFTAKTYGDEIKLSLQHSDDYRATARYLEQHQYRYVIFNIDREPQLRVVIKRMHSQVPIEDIKLELENVYDLSITKISRLNRSPQATYGSSLILVQLPNIPANKSIYNITQLLGLTIQIEDFKPQPRVIQCYNCQQFHHGSLSCHNLTHCVKCAGPHRATECKKPKDRTPLCYNCRGPHPSNFRGCPAFPQNTFGRISHRLPVPTAPRNTPANFPTINPSSFTTPSFNPTIPNRSYSTVVQATSSSNTNLRIDKLENLMATLLTQQNNMMQSFQHYMTGRNG